MSCEQYSDWLGDAVDGTLDGDKQTALEAHCQQCSACRELLDDLREIRATAATLDRLTPSPETWSTIAARIQEASSPAELPPPHHAAPATRQRVALVEQWRTLAAAAAVLLILGTAAWFGVARQWNRPNGGTSAELVRSAASELLLAEQHYENAIVALERLTANKDQSLDPVVSGQIAQSLLSIDRAINDSRAALKTEPNSFIAQTSLLDALRMKVALLQETVSLMNARS